MAMRNAAYQLAEDAEQYILATIRKGAGTKVSGAIPTADKGGLYGLLISIKNALDLKHVPRFERKLIVPIAIEGQLLMDERFVNGSAAVGRTCTGGFGRSRSILCWMKPCRRRGDCCVSRSTAKRTATRDIWRGRLRSAGFWCGATASG